MAEFLCSFFKSDIGTELVKRERIVRCRDCRYSFIGSLSGVTRCMRAADRYIYGFACLQVAPDGFCAWGEERED